MELFLGRDRVIFLPHIIKKGFFRNRKATPVPGAQSG
jgi:hypothetical protein